MASIFALIWPYRLSYSSFNKLMTSSISFSCSLTFSPTPSLIFWVILSVVKSCSIITGAGGFAASSDYLACISPIKTLCYLIELAMSSRRADICWIKDAPSWPRSIALRRWLFELSSVTLFWPTWTSERSLSIKELTSRNAADTVF